MIKCIWILFLLPIMLAQAAPSSEIEPPISTEKIKMPVAEVFDLNQLESPKTPEEFLKLLRLISENFLLLDSDFEKDEFLLKLFGPGEISDPYAAYPKHKGLQNKGLNSKNNSLFMEQFKVNGIGFGFATFLDQMPVKRAASLGFTTSVPENPFTAELVALDSPVNTNWRDPLGGFNAIASHENIDAAGRRPRKTHPKGYFAIDEFHENGIYKSNLFIELNGNGTIRLLQIDQKEK